jgi:hypothetical protein
VPAPLCVANDGLCEATACNPIDPDCACAADNQCTAACADPSKDPDCVRECGANGVCALVSCAAPDPDCSPLGESCASEANCQGRKCLNDPQHPSNYCSKACAANADCPQGMECLAATSACRFLQLPEVAPGGACTQGASLCTGGTVCAGGVCATPCATASDCSGATPVCAESAEGPKICRSALLEGSRPGAGSGSGTTSADGKGGLAVTEVVGGCAASAGGPSLGLMVMLGALAARKRQHRA